MLSKTAIRNLAANGQTYSRGLDYYQRGSIKSYSYSPQEKRISAIVSGSERYAVEIELNQAGDVVDYNCSCPAYAQYDGACKHTVAVLLNYLATSLRLAPDSLSESDAAETKDLQLQLVRQNAEPPQSDPRLALSRSLVSKLMDETQTATAPKETVQLLVILHCDPKFSRPAPYLTLQMGNGRFYMVKKIVDLMDAVVYRHELHFGKSFVFQPQRQSFKPADQPLIDMLVEAFHDEHFTQGLNVYSLYNKNLFELTPSRLERFLNFAGAMENALWMRENHGETRPIRIRRDVPPFQLQLVPGQEHLELKLQAEKPIYTLNARRNIFVSGDCFFLPPAAAIQPLLPVLESFARVSRTALPLTDADAAAFISQAAPALQTVCRLAIAPEIEARLSQEPLTVLAWLDRYGRGISAKVVFKYGTNELNPLAPPPSDSADTQLLIRELPREASFLETLKAAGFEPRDDRYVLEDEELTYQFLVDTLPGLLDSAEVYRSEAFDKLRIKPSPRFNGAIRLDESSDLLEVSFQTDDLSPAELAEFIAAIREKRRYYRLKSGDFIPLERPEIVAVGKLLAQLGLTGKDLQKNLITMPKYRALYLDRAVRDYSRERFNLNAAFKQLVRSVRDPQEMEVEPPAALASVLRDYQKTGLKWLKTLADYGFGGILADDMGLGKTLQVIVLVMVTLEHAAPKLPSLVVAPTSLVYNWREEIAKFAPELSVLILDGPKEERDRLLQQAPDYAFVITSYPLIRRDIEAIQELEFAFCFLDEAQHIKNPETINAKSVKAVKARRYFALTGTPIENSLTELWSIFDFIMPGYLYSHHKFQNQFEKPIVKANDPAALEDLGQHIRPFILRRLKKDVLTELPEKIETKLSCAMAGEQQKIYLAYLAKARNELEAEVEKNGFEKSQLKILALLTRLRQICCHPGLFIEDYGAGSAKLELLLELVRDSLSGGHRLLIFSQFVTMLELIAAQLRQEGTGFSRIDGQTPAQERLQLVNAFNAGQTEIMLISLKAGGTGLNLTGADTVIHYDPWWNPAVEDQATDRAYRIGQRNVVQVFKLVTQGTIEEKIYAMQQRKRQLVDAVIQPGENFLAKMTLTEIRGLFAE